MAISRAGDRASQLRVCLDAAAEYHLDAHRAADIIDAMVAVIDEQWDEAADAASLTQLERAQLWGNQILSPFIFYRWPH